MSLFDGPRLFYHNGRKPWVYSMDLIIIIIVFLFFAFAFILIVPGIRGRASLEAGRLLNYRGEKPLSQTGSIFLFICLRLQKYLVLLLEVEKPLPP
ncbi:hypothetical protein FKM82_026033 [Ascaphus truei]